MKRARLPQRRASSASGGIVSFSASANALRFAAEVLAPPLAALFLAAPPFTTGASSLPPALAATPAAGESAASFSRSSASEAGESQSETNTIRRSVVARSASVWPWPADLATSEEGKAGAAAAAMTPMNSHMKVPAFTGCVRRRPQPSTLSPRSVVGKGFWAPSPLRSAGVLSGVQRKISIAACIPRPTTLLEQFMSHPQRKLHS
mmetsp:Transcript_37430/g.101386  ORF Transcript_37430/g.101386 Transcript_37430/m.101386 type:complete len:205 (+) Transcript_37430:217-831(+)